ncbi:MAG: hypothetical protein HJJLKODD_02672 [Phycisphaerae bacterium]|nr:hypothetical protein [Phycisphaerae bacterium]
MSRNGNGNGQARTGQPIRCAIYTRKSTEEGLEQEFNSLDAQREAAEAYIASQLHEGWVCLPDHYDDGGFTGANMERPALQRLFDNIQAAQIDCVVVYKVDRLSRSLMDFARMMEIFEKHRVSFVSVTQQFNTTHSMGRLTLNILLSFAQFEREIISERTRDKIAAARRKGKWSGGMPVLGYDVDPHNLKLVVNDAEAERVREIFNLYVEKQSLIQTAKLLNERGWTTKHWTTRKGTTRGGQPFDKQILHRLLTNVTYLGQVRYKDEIHKGEHEAIVDEPIWQSVQRMVQSNGRTGGMHLHNKYGALLKGLVYCKPCESMMGHSYTVKKGHRCYRYYVCYTAQKRGWHACPSKSLPAEEIERFVVEQIRTIGREPQVRAMTLEQVREQQPQVSKAEVDSALATFDPLWDTLSPREQSRVIRLLVKRVDYDGAKGKVAVTFHGTGGWRPEVGGKDHP